MVVVLDLRGLGELHLEVEIEIAWVDYDVGDVHYLGVLFVHLWFLLGLFGLDLARDCVFFGLGLVWKRRGTGLSSFLVFVFPWVADAVVADPVSAVRKMIFRTVA